MKLLKKQLIAKRPEERTGVYCFIFNTPEKDGLMKIYSYIKRSDTSEISYIQFSSDNGKTWTAPKAVITGKETAAGTERYNFSHLLLDESRKRMIIFKVKGLLPTDEPLEGLKHWNIWYAVSEDGGRTNIIEEQLILQDDEYHADHPVDGVWIGRNSLMLGDVSTLAIMTKYQKDEDVNGMVLLPVQISPTDADGNYYNPGGGHSYHYSAVIRGRIEEAGRMQWLSITDPVQNRPEESTRGALEATLAEMKDGRILMVMRGSNGGRKDPENKIPSYRWYSISEDGAKTFSTPQPWRFNDGEKFFSPSSCSQLLEHSNGRYYWIGNINRENSIGNMPRNPLFICEVDQQSLLLKRETLCTIADVGEEQSTQVTFSNFFAREERGTGDVLVYITAFHADPENIFGADAYEYRIGDF